jgi:hypothetical protein
MKHNLIILSNFQRNASNNRAIFGPVIVVRKLNRKRSTHSFVVIDKFLEDVLAGYSCTSKQLLSKHQIYPIVQPTRHVIPFQCIPDEWLVVSKFTRSPRAF